MGNTFGDNTFDREVPAEIANPGDFDAGAEIPSHLDVLPDGRETLITGDPEGDRAFTHRQGENLFGFEGTCGLCSCENVLRSFGLQVTEADIVNFASLHGLCNIDSPDPAMCGGTTAEWQAEILTRLGIPASQFQGGTLEDLAANIDQGRGIIVEINAGVVWNDPNYDSGGYANHAITVTGVARDPMSGEIQGFYINDSGSGRAAQFVDASTMREAWQDAGGAGVVTVESRPWNE
jgi:hypothetical protein